MKCLVIGAGSIGQRHLRNLRTLGIEHLAVCEPDSHRLAAAAADFQADPHGELPSALAQFQPDVVLVCTPPALHVSQARQSLKAQSHVFIEKPLSHNLTEIDQLISETEQTRRVVQVGYNLRFHPGLQHVKQICEQGIIGRILWSRAEFGQYLPDWRPAEDYRRSYTAQRSMGGGILLDASHELDYMTWLLGLPESASCAAGKSSELDVDVEDSATVLLHYSNGSHADVHVDFLQRVYSRSCSLAGENGTVIWDYSAQQTRLFLVGAQQWQITECGLDPNEMYLAELRDFLSRVRDGRTDQVSLRHSAAVLRIVLTARAAAENGRRMPIEW